MDKRNRGRMIFAVILILFGAYLLAMQFFPALRVYGLNESNWPLIVIGAGVLLLILGLLSGNHDLMIPACIVGGIGGILYWQNMTGDWASWAYAWALIPTFAGVGIFLKNLLDGNLRKAIIAGGAPILIGLAAFFILASFMGVLSTFGQYWPLLLVLLGVILLAQVFLRKA
jgi:hypothetical protein